MKIAICDDEIVLQELLTSHVREWMNIHHYQGNIHTYSSAEQFIFEYDENKVYDFVILDIQMKEMNGMDLAKWIRSNLDNCSILFVTAVMDYVFEGYSVDAITYILKPVDKELLYRALDKAKDRMKINYNYMIYSQEGVSRLPLDKVLYIESCSHDCNFYIEEGGNYLTKLHREGIQNIEKELSSMGYNFFIRIHRSYLVNLKRISKITKKDVVLEGGSIIPIARGKWEDLHLKYMEYIRENLRRG